MSIKFANNAFGTLNAGISSSDTSLTLSSGQGARFPVLASGEYFYITLIDTSNNLEVVKCTARATDVLTVTRAQDNTTARAFVIGDRVELRVTAAALEDSSNPYDKDTSSTGSFALPVGTTAQQPAAADTEGHIRYDSDDSVVYYSDGSSWIKIAAKIAQLTSVSGAIYVGEATTLTLSGGGFMSANLVVNFTQASDSINEDVTVTPASDSSATVTVPAAVYNNVTAGNAVSISVTNEDQTTSGVQTVTAQAVPSGGTVTTSGSYRIHTFTSSGTLTVPSGFSKSADYLTVAGGGAGGSSAGGSGGGGGGGAGGMITGTTTLSSNLTVTIGGGGAGNAGTYGNNGINTSVTGLTTCTGGGGGGGGQNNASAAVGRNGGSGGGGGYRGYTTQSNYGSGTSGQGNRGGGVSSVSAAGGGGGGKGGVGGVNTGSGGGVGGSGGTGSASSITGSSVTYAAGGQGGTSGSGASGAVNKGGGGAGQYGNGTAGHSGGSGVFIIRYIL